ncbi:MAG: cytochrome c oxidase accessory protein CcoG [Bacteroidota bacterium]|jgi:cytochrome c oxidase accessory protein FixG
MYDDQSFRDHIGTITEDGKRNHLHPKKVKGRFTTYRRGVAWFLLALLFGLPWLSIQGLPVIQLDVVHRRFVLFGQVFWPQDFYLLMLTMLLGVLAVVVFTVAYGRIFCGWICPQTIFMEHVFRRIEYWIDGDRNAQIKLRQSPWTWEKIQKRLLKNGIFLVISFAIANTFLMYFIQSKGWLTIVTDGPAAHPGGFAGIWIFTGVFFFVFSWFREQVCLIVCPYGRLQGVLLDRNSIVIAYDRIRGELRGRFRKNEDRTAAGKGDCIDCELCVAVCPTGIDIRNGTQLECTNCTACIDACDGVMERLEKPKGLIRYASETQIVERKGFAFTPRLKAYSVILVALLTLWASLLLFRSPVEATILRVPNQLYQERESAITNLYNYKLLNKRPESVTVTMAVREPEGGWLEFVQSDRWELEPQGRVTGAFFLALPKPVGPETDIVLEVLLDGEVVDVVKTSFFGPH